MHRPVTRAGGFTLVELLVVIAIIGVLVGMLLPAVQSARESGRRSQCQSNLRQVALAAIRHTEVYGCFPPGVPNCVVPTKFGVAGGSSAGAWCQGPTWTIAIMPYIEEQSQFDLIKACMEKTCNVCEECTSAVPPPSPYFCPSAAPVETDFYFTALGLTNLAKTNYVGNFGADTYLSYKTPTLAGLFDIVDVRGAKGAPINQVAHDPSMRGGWKMGSKLGVKDASVQDGLSNTILISELLPYLAKQDGRGAWSFGGMGGVAFTTALPPNALGPDVLPSCEPGPTPPGGYLFNCTVDPNPGMPGATMAAARSAHSGGVMTAAADGSVHFIEEGIDPTLWKNLGTRKGNAIAAFPAE